MKLKKIIQLTLLLGFFMGTLASQAAVKIAVVDIQKVISSSKEGKAAQKKLKKEINRKKKKLDKLEADLKAIRKDLEKKSLVMSEQVKQKRTEEFQKKIYEFQQLRVKSEQEIRMKEQKLTQPIFKKIQKAIQSVAKKEKYTLVLQKAPQGILYSEPSIDITQKILKVVGK